MRGRPLRNWNNSDVSHPAVIAVPKNLDELIAVVKNKDKYPSPVRPAGHRHSTNACFTTTGTQVFLYHFQNIDVDVAARTVTVGAYVTMIAIRDAVNKHGLQMEVAPEIGNATAGSAACCGTKDACLGPNGLGQVSSTVLRMKLVNAQGELEEIDARRDPEKMRLMRSSNGLFGILYEVTFNLEELQILSYRYTSFPLDRLPTREQIFGNGDGVLGFMLPYSNRIMIERRSIAHPGTRVSPVSRAKRWLRDRLWENVASLLTTRLPFNRFYYIMDKLIFIWISTLGLSGGFNSERDDSMIDFKTKRTHYLDFTFWGIPMSRWHEYIPAYVKFCKEFERETGFRCCLPSEVYFMNHDDHAVLSYTISEGAFTADNVDVRPTDPLWLEFNRRYNDFAVSFGAKPLFNQTKELSRDNVYKSLGAAWEKFVAQRQEADPEGRFLSDYYKNLI